MIAILRSASVGRRVGVQTSPGDAFGPLEEGTVTTGPTRTRLGLPEFELILVLFTGQKRPPIGN